MLLSFVLHLLGARRSLLLARRLLQRLRDGKALFCPNCGEVKKISVSEKGAHAPSVNNGPPPPPPPPPPTTTNGQVE